jgi:hypothetical protein
MKQAGVDAHETNMIHLKSFNDAIMTVHSLGLGPMDLVLA